MELRSVCCSSLLKLQVCLGKFTQLIGSTVNNKNSMLVSISTNSSPSVEVAASLRQRMSHRRRAQLNAHVEAAWTEYL